MTPRKWTGWTPLDVARMARRNGLLLVFAIGLVMVDLTCFHAFEARHALPSADRVHAGPPAMSQLVKPAPLAARPGTTAARTSAPTAVQIDPNALASAR